MSDDLEGTIFRGTNGHLIACELIRTTWWKENEATMRTALDECQSQSMTAEQVLPQGISNEVSHTLTRYRFIGGQTVGHEYTERGYGRERWATTK